MFCYKTHPLLYDNLWTKNDIHKKLLDFLMSALCLLFLYTETFKALKDGWTYNRVDLLAIIRGNMPKNIKQEFYIGSDEPLLDIFY